MSRIFSISDFYFKFKAFFNKECIADNHVITIWKGNKQDHFIYEML